MSTQIKNTLFRFVTMRAPQLTKDVEKNERFIFRNEDGTLGFFDEIVQNKPISQTKWQAMKEAATNFTFLKLDEIKAIDRKLFDFSDWLIANRDKVTQQELDTQIVGLTAITDKAALTQLWDNLFYQTVTQNDFYCKEASMQLLISNHLISKYDRINFDQAKRLINAKIVFPKKLFIEEKEVAENSPSKSLSKLTGDEVFETVASDEMVNQQRRAEAILKKEQLKKLEFELKAVHRKYKKEYEAAYEVAKEEHLLIIKPLREEYEAKLEEAKRAWCAIKDPQVSYDPLDPCQQPEYVKQPEYPKFIFNYNEILDTNYLSQNLSEESFEALLELTGKDFSPEKNLSRMDASAFELTDVFENFEDLQQYISIETGNNQEIINQNTFINENTSVSIGGVLIPAITAPANTFGFVICPKTFSIRKYFNCDLSIQVPDHSWNLSKFEYTLEKTTGNYNNNGLVSYSISRVGNTIYINNIQIGNPTIINEPEITSFRGTITFTNGRKAFVEVPSFHLQTCFKGKIILESIEDEIGNLTDEYEVFVPSGFGVKQLGITDYKKVEQTTHSYIEGEVAHIENIMAREYKDKTTRKLRRNELTSSTSNENEHEKLSDTSTTSRFEMQNEVATVIQNNKDFYANANVSYRPIQELTLGASAGFATNSSKENSTRQAITQAKEITDKALDRIVTKVKQERIEKIMEEFEETNSHGFDNRNGDKHVVGVYRWVDKIYKNQIVNYGKRLMFEFMIPQPAKLHTLGLKSGLGGSKLIEPVDPRVYDKENKGSNSLNLSDYSKINESTIKFWASKYNVEIQSNPAETIHIGKSFSNNTVSSGGYQDGHETFHAKENLKIPEGYYTKNAQVSWASIEDGDWRQAHGMHFGIGNLRFTDKAQAYPSPTFSQQLKRFEGEIPLSVYYLNSFVFNATATIECGVTPEFKQKWQQETFKAIIDGYEEALAVYNEKLAQEKALGVQIKGTNPGFYREFENKILRKNCISYIISQNPNSKFTYGRNDLSNNEDTFEKYEVNVNESLDKYTSFVKFIEQAFEWDILSYHLYPYYWGNRSDWSSLYQYDDTNDPLFRNFMQAGMARVVITVRPGFEEAVRYYMQTGQIWNGGEVPVIEDPMYLSIVDELTEIKSEKEGKAWWSRVPTAMTILQAESIGLNVEKALPENEDFEDFEDPTSVPRSQGISISQAQIGGENSSKTASLAGKIIGNQGVVSKILLKKIDGTTQDLTYCDSNGIWKLNHLPAGRYELLLDAENDFPTDSFIVTEGTKELVVELVNETTVEVNLVVKKL
ncbi:hypothetical protein [Flavobacterium sp. NRK F7]|uniref:hypothetical protein n=1 Tax=Flavobacterium sp. NRK F7 TaxID=2954930 RepID=UPI002091387C|nr:hypothetical protein [Flavobacterium sp. NRK F7]MCO6161671.1 hypothetical protein [Flavobacterium sp. NRK F7]